MARGSITPRPTQDGKMRYRIKWESRGPNGKRRYHSATCATKKAAEALLAEKLDEVEKGLFIQATKETVASFLDRWLTAKAPNLSDASAYQYASTIRSRIKPYLGTVPLSRIDALTIQKWHAELQDKSYASRTITAAHAVLDNALSQAVAWRAIPRNPADGVIVPQSRSRVPDVWSADEAAAFLAKAEECHDRYLPLWRLGLDTGMRLGEMLALSWRDVSSDRAVVTVRRTLTRNKHGGWQIGEHGKTSSSHRSIILGPAAHDSIRALRPRQNERRLAVGAAWHDSDLVFDRGDGSFFNPSTVEYAFGAATKRAGVPRITPHAMRHTMATLMLAAGIHPKIVQERLGHKSIKMTMDRYSHVSMTMQEDAAAIIDAILNPEPAGGVCRKARPRRGHGT